MARKETKESRAAAAAKTQFPEGCPCVVGKGQDLMEKYSGEDWDTVLQAAQNGIDGLRLEPERSISTCFAGEFALRSIQTIGGKVAGLYQQNF